MKVILRGEAGNFESSMKKQKNGLTIVLMVSSIVLVLALEAVWLQSIFRDVKRDLRRETSFLFSSTIMAMQDSVLEKNIKPLPSDSIGEFAGRIGVSRDTLRINNVHIEVRKPQAENVIFFGSGRPDSIKKYFRPMFSKLRGNRRQRGFVMQVTFDSLKPEAIKKNFEMALTKASMRMDFSIERIKEHSDRSGRRETATGFDTEPFPFFQRGSFYVARFSDVTLFVLKKLYPQLLFSFFLTTLTLGAFYMMYKSIISNQRLLEIKNDFIGNMTHELKTPIATVSVALESLKNFNALDDPQRTREYIEMAQQELNRLSILTDKVLKTAIFESNGLTLQLEQADLEKIAGHVIDSMKLIFEKHHAKINFAREGSTFNLNGSVDHLTNVVYNLVDNALKYSKGTPEITLSLVSTKDNIVLSVRDNGLGIAEEHQKRIFEKFYRVPTGDVANIKGYGLGLSYVQNVVKLHKGTISVDSTLGEGTTFIITLPKLIV
ncbi:hypothetical protein WSM22_21580 [Cytophagales bacterium WSM2-2]|nr:hypothetical protein WSM22_21580 [Cytophagales bacterium WSM2-2]